jgi:hypothetical protein
LHDESKTVTVVQLLGLLEVPAVQVQFHDEQATDMIVNQYNIISSVVGSVAES